MPKPAVLISIEATSETEAQAFGRPLIQTLCDEDPRLVPELVSTTDRYKEPFLGIDKFMSEWWAKPIDMYIDQELVGRRFQGPSWKRKSTVANRGMVRHGILDANRKRTKSSIWFESRWIEDISFNHLFNVWVEHSSPEIGLLHLFTEREVGSLQTEDGSWFQTGSFGGPAKPGIPNIGWAMAYGGDYAKEVDVARIKAAGFPVFECHGAMIVQVTENLSDVVDKFAHFSRRRAELKAMFRPELFWIKDEPLAEV